MLLQLACKKAGRGAGRGGGTTSVTQRYVSQQTVGFDPAFLLGHLGLQHTICLFIRSVN